MKDFGASSRSRPAGANLRCPDASRIDRGDTVAALYVETDGCYFGLAGVDPWDEARDARLYAGPHPIVAHPPCQRWGKMWAGSPSVIAKTGVRKVKGADGGCFASALLAVRRFGGVIEHPWGSHAWPHFGLNTPPRNGGWIAADFYGGWTCCVEQGRYGHYARKPTLLLAYRCELPELEWGVGKPRIPQWAIDKYGLARAKRIGELSFKGGGTDSSPRIGTPEPFRELLLGMARSVLAERLMRQNDYDEAAQALSTLTDEVAALTRELAAAPCQTKSNDDAESGCCGPCRARATLTKGEGVKP